MADGTEDITTLQAHSEVRGFSIEVIKGPQRGAVWKSSGQRCSIGSHASNDIVIDDATVSRFHCEIVLAPRGPRVRDLESRNGVEVDGVAIVDAYLRDGSQLRLGHTSVAFRFGAERNRIPLSTRTELGALVGISADMRAAFAMIEHVAATDATILLEGETGTGKEAAAEAIHQVSARRDRPFVVVDCSALPRHLLDSELFGHEAGAFTGAISRRTGAFELAHTGTVFFDEIGEMPLDLQPKLLRVLEQREIRRLGSEETRRVDLRVIAATNRDLREEVNAGRFRSDLYFRLAVIKIGLPALRRRPEDIPLLVSHLLRTFDATPEVTAALTAPAFIAELSRAAWPGNVRELRNYIQRCLVFREPLPIADRDESDVEAAATFQQARTEAIAMFERQFVEACLHKHGGKVAQAARSAGIARTYFYGLMRRHGITT